MQYSETVSLDCPHCETKCQFLQIDRSHNFCTENKLYHIAYVCTNCRGLITTKWHCDSESPHAFQTDDLFGTSLHSYSPPVGDWQPRVDLSLIVNEEVRKDFQEAIGCYNNGFYNACMIMARRAIQQEMIIKDIKRDNLYKQIESLGISKNLKNLLHKVKIFGNHGAHPDFCLYDEKGNKIEDIKAVAKLSLDFLDRYFSDGYEINSLIAKAPKSEKELENQAKK